MRDGHLSGAWTHPQSSGACVQPLPHVPCLEESLSEAPLSTSWTELTRDIWDLDDDQLCKVLEALQTKMVQRGEITPQLGHPRGI